MFDDDSPNGLFDALTLRPKFRLALLAWIDCMSVALHGVPVQEVQPPEGVVRAGDDWRYAEWAEGGFIDSLGVDGQAISPTLAVRPATPPVSSDSP